MKVKLGLAAVGLIATSLAIYCLYAPPCGFKKYKFAVGKGSLEVDELAALEKRVKDFPGRGIDLGDLALRYVSQARAQGNRSFYEKAAAAARASLKVLPVSNAAAHVALAKVAESGHDFEGAIAEANLALKDSADSTGAWSVLVTSNLARGEVIEAASAADRLVQLRPTTGHYGLKALTLLAQNRRMEAEFIFQRAFAAEESGNRADASWTRALLGRHWLTHGELRKSAWMLGESIRIAPESDFAHSLLAELYLKKKDFPSAEKEARRALELSPQPRYLRLLGQIQGARNDSRARDGFLKEAERSVRDELKESRQGHRLELLQILLEQGGKEKIDEAIQLGRQEIEVRHSSESYYWLARAFAAGDKPELALTALEESFRRGERLPERYAFAAKLQRRFKNEDAARLYDKLSR